MPLDEFLVRRKRYLESGAFDIALRRRIRQERDREQRVTIDEVCRRISGGEIVRAVGNLLFHTPPAVLDEKLEVVLDKISRAATSRDVALQTHVLDFLVSLAIGLRSFLPNWILSPALDSAAIDVLAGKVTDALANLTLIAGQAAAELAARLRKETLARLKAEGITDESQAATMADSLMGDSLVDYVSNIAAELRRSNLMRAAECVFKAEPRPSSATTTLPFSSM